MFSVAELTQQTFVRRRLNLNMDQKTASALKELSERDGSLTESIRRAVAVAKTLTDETEHGRVIETADVSGRHRVRSWFI